MVTTTTITTGFRLGLMNDTSDFPKQFKVALLKYGTEVVDGVAKLMNSATQYSGIPLNYFVSGFGPVTSTKDRNLLNMSGQSSQAFTITTGVNGIQAKTKSGIGSPFDFTNLDDNISVGYVIYQGDTGLIASITAFDKAVGVGVITFTDDVMVELR